MAVFYLSLSHTIRRTERVPPLSADGLALANSDLVGEGYVMSMAKGTSYVRRTCARGSVLSYPYWQQARKSSHDYLDQVRSACRCQGGASTTALAK